MSALGLSHPVASQLVSRPLLARPCLVASRADYRREHFIFERTQSPALRALEWEDRIHPLSSWCDLLLPWIGLAAGLGVAAFMVL